MRKNISTESAPKAIGPYAQAVVASAERLVFCSGQIPIDPKTGEMVGAGDVRVQCERVLENLGAVLAAVNEENDRVAQQGLVAGELARRLEAHAVVTGESLGQVASQTIENIATVDAVATMPLLRPLIGTDKREIIAAAERLGTFAISVRPDQDCCQLFVPSKPVTKSWPTQADAAEADLAVDALVEDAIARTEKADLS